ncbi:TonB-dependent receptor plug domain-containing protein, partial [bacterium]|nr:TonB-dependent receptor plug domain-containing protein [bacterium]
MQHNKQQPMATLSRRVLLVLWWILLLLSIAVLIGSLLCFGENAFAQDAPTRHLAKITGVVRDASTRESVAGANVIVLGTNRGAATDLEGRFVILHIQPGTWSLRASAVGYTPQTQHEINVSPARPARLEFLLHPSAVESEAVTVTAQQFQVSTPEMPTSVRNLRYEEVRRAPGAVEDVQRAVRALPGVVSDNDQDNAIIVRGGDASENLTVIDGLEVGNTNHLTIGDEVQGGGGPINALNTEFLRDVTFASGGFSVRYGDRLSSVLDLELREGNREQFGGELSLSMAGAGAYAEGPIQEGRGSFLASIRKSYLDLIPEESAGVSSWPAYWNGQFKAVYDITPRHILTLNGLYLEDSARNDPPDPDEEDENADLSVGIDALDLNTTRYLVGARLRSLWGPGYTDLIVGRSFAFNRWNYYSQIQTGEDEHTLRKDVANRRTLAHDQFHLHWVGRGFGEDRLSAGVTFKPITYHREAFIRGDSILYNDDFLGPDPGNEPDVFRYDDQVEDVREIALQYATYVQYTWRPLGSFDLTAGLRYDDLDFSERNALGPRASLSRRFLPHWSFNAAWGLYY